MPGVEVAAEPLGGVPAEQVTIPDAEPVELRTVGTVERSEVSLEVAGLDHPGLELAEHGEKRVDEAAEPRRACDREVALAQDGIDKKTVTAFSLAFLVYNLKFLWAWVVDGIRLPILGRLGQRVSWMLLVGVLVMAAVANLALADPVANIAATATAAVLVGAAGATFDIVIDAYRIEILEPRQLGVGSGMSQYGWRIGSAGAASLALVVAARAGWEAAYLACALLALPAMIAALVIGEPQRHREPVVRRSAGEAIAAVWRPFTEFFQRPGAGVVLVFILIHKIGDTLSQLVLRLLLDDLKFSNDEIALYDVGIDIGRAHV